MLERGNARREARGAVVSRENGGVPAELIEDPPP
jgi:hypothetical protein